MTGTDETRADIAERSTAVTSALRSHVRDREALAVVKAPPGSGKTYLLLQAVTEAVGTEQRVAVAAQTNAQADDICRRLSKEHPGIPTVRLSGTGRSPIDLGDGVRWVVDKSALPRGPAAVVGTTAKWATIQLESSFDVLLVDEAWQMDWADFMLLGQVSARFVLIGDPGQIPPVVSIDVDRWETSPRGPHIPAPDIILEDPSLRSAALSLELPACRRLPHDSVDLIQQFYDFSFSPWALPGDRTFAPTGGTGDGIDGVIDQIAEGSYAAATLPTSTEGPPLELDPDIVDLTVEIAVRMLERGAKIDVGDDKLRPLTASDIGIAATHRVVNAAIQAALPSGIRNDLRVATPERWQGLQRPIMIAVHPLSGITQPSAFDLETGRLCVMASRHQVGLIVVGRDHIPQTLASHIPSADQAIGRPDVTGRGHDQHTRFWGRLVDEGRVQPI